MAERSTGGPLPWASLAAVIAGLTVASMTGGFNAPLFSARLDAAGYGASLIGLSAAANAIGLFVVAPLAPALLARHGLARVMIVTSLLEVALYLGCALSEDFYVWTFLRLLMGGIGGVLWIAGEVWITQAATDATRGRVLAIYNSFFGLGTAAGPTVLSAVGHQGALPFVVAAVIVLVSVLPILWARALAPVIEPDGSGGGFAVRALLAPLRLAAVPMMLNLSYALVFAGLWTFLPVFAVDTGLPVERAFQQLTAFSVGTIVLQFPVGWLSDRFDRRLIATVLIAGSLAAVASMNLFVHVPGLDFAYFFVLGGIVSGVYVVALSLIGERFRGSALAAAITVYTLMWSAGSMIGPPLVGLATQVVGADGLPLALVAFTLVFLPFTAASWLRHRRAAGTPSA